MLNVSIVLYQTPVEEVLTIIQTLKECKQVHTIFLIDNSPIPTQVYEPLGVVYLSEPQNIGYGKAHNMALRESIKSQVPFHLVVNSDVLFESTILDKALLFMKLHLDVAQLMPKVFYPDGKIQYLCKLLPSPLDLFGRRFLPHALIQKRNARFELQQSGYNQCINAPYLSGCFMLLRVSALQQVGLFDERFFMYPEDIDLTRRLHRHFKTLFYPEISVIHAHQKASYRNKRMLGIHLVNIIRYFNKWGWFFDKERNMFNKQVLDELTLKQDTKL